MQWINFLSRKLVLQWQPKKTLSLKRKLKKSFLGHRTFAIKTLRWWWRVNLYFRLKFQTINFDSSKDSFSKVLPTPCLWDRSVKSVVGVSEVYPILLNMCIQPKKIVRDLCKINLYLWYTENICCCKSFIHSPLIYTLFISFL